MTNLKIPTIYFPICDQNLWILKIYSYLFKKFWGDEHKVVVMGFQEPDFDLPDNFSFVSLADKQEGGSKKWTKYIYDYFTNIDDEYIIFALEDFFPTMRPNKELIGQLLHLMQSNQNIGKADLTWDTFINVFDKNNKVRKNYRQIKNLTGCKVLEVPKNAPYRITTQPSIWRRDYILEFLNNDWSPWDFEILGTEKSNTLDDRIIACADSSFVNYPTKWIHKGAVSRFHEDKINILGLDTDTIKELINEKLVKEEQLQWGQWNGPVPMFNELGGYDFDPKMMPPHEASPTNWKEYTPTYNSNTLVLNLFDVSFSHTKSLWGYIAANGTNIWGKPKTVHYVSGKQNYDEVSLFVDDMIYDTNLINSVKSKYKVGWIIEPRDVKERPYDGIDKNHDLFDLIITFDKQSIDKYNNCKHLVWCESRVKDEEWGKWDLTRKNKLVSMIASNKTMTAGHRFRFEIANSLAKKHKIDLWGNAFKKFDEKTEPLAEYFFSIVSNNSTQDNFFTEALCDCFALKTGPIFRGCENIGDFFDKKGIITFQTLEELDIILSNLTIEDYNKKLEAIENNFKTSNKFRKSVDDQLGQIIREELGL